MSNEIACQLIVNKHLPMIFNYSKHTERSNALSMQVNFKEARKFSIEDLENCVRVYQKCESSK